METMTSEPPKATKTIFLGALAIRTSQPSIQAHPGTLEHFLETLSSKSWTSVRELTTYFRYFLLNINTPQDSERAS